MAKVSTERFRIEAEGNKELFLDFKIDINVTKDGMFSATLPKEVVEEFKKSQIDLATNRARNEGYFSDWSMEQLKQQIIGKCNHLLSRELIAEKIIIKYSIQTMASYVIDKDGDIFPNGVYENVTGWRDGTKILSSTDQSPFGILIYAKPFYRRDYRFKNGAIKTEYEGFNPFGSGTVQEDESNKYLCWLQGLTSISPSGETQEIDYTEDTAKFFVDAIKAICRINEKLKDIISPEKIKEIVEKGAKLLG